MTRYIERVNFHRFLRILRIILVVGAGAIAIISAAIWASGATGLLAAPLWICLFGAIGVAIGGAVLMINDMLKEARGDEEGDS